MDDMPSRIAHEESAKHLLDALGSGDYDDLCQTADSNPDALPLFLDMEGLVRVRSILHDLSSNASGSGNVANVEKVLDFLRMLPITMEMLQDSRIFKTVQDLHRKSQNQSAEKLLGFWRTLAKRPRAPSPSTDASSSAAKKFRSGAAVDENAGENVDGQGIQAQGPVSPVLPERTGVFFEENGHRFRSVLKRISSSNAMALIPLAPIPKQIQEDALEQPVEDPMVAAQQQPTNLLEMSESETDRYYENLLDIARHSAYRNKRIVQMQSSANPSESDAGDGIPSPSNANNTTATTTIGTTSGNMNFLSSHQPVLAPTPTAASSREASAASLFSTNGKGGPAGAGGALRWAQEAALTRSRFFFKGDEPVVQLEESDPTLSRRRAELLTQGSAGSVYGQTTIIPAIISAPIPGVSNYAKRDQQLEAKVQSMTAQIPWRSPPEVTGAYRVPMKPGQPANPKAWDAPVTEFVLAERQRTATIPPIGHLPPSQRPSDPERGSILFHQNPIPADVLMYNRIQTPVIPVEPVRAKVVQPLAASFAVNPGKALLQSLTQNAAQNAAAVSAPVMPNSQFNALQLLLGAQPQNAQQPMRSTSSAPVQAQSQVHSHPVQTISPGQAEANNALLQMLSGATKSSVHPPPSVVPNPQASVLAALLQNNASHSQASTASMHTAQSGSQRPYGVSPAAGIPSSLQQQLHPSTSQPYQSNPSSQSFHEKTHQQYPAYGSLPAAVTSSLYGSAPSSGQVPYGAAKAAAVSSFSSSSYVSASSGSAGTPSNHQGPYKKFPCRYWMDGRCSRGDACTFRHDPADFGKNRP
eukprot:ANDGO_08588.mRNA.1 hypothetical protein